MLISDDEQDALSTDPDELLDSDDSDGISGDEEDIFRSLLARAGFHLSYGDNPPLLLDPSQLQVTLREKLLMDAGAVAAFLAGLSYLCCVVNIFPGDVTMHLSISRSAIVVS